MEHFLALLLDVMTRSEVSSKIKSLERQIKWLIVVVFFFFAEPSTCVSRYLYPLL